MSTKAIGVERLHHKLERCMVAFRDFTSPINPATEREAKRFYDDAEPFLYYYKVDEIFLTPEIIAQCERLIEKLNVVRAGMSPLPNCRGMLNEDKFYFYKRRRLYHQRIQGGEIADDVKELKELLRKHVEEPASAIVEEPSATTNARASLFKGAGIWALDHIVGSLIVTVVGGIIVAAMISGC